VKEIILKLIILQSLDDKIKLWQRTASEGPSKLTQARQKLTELEAQLADLTSKLTENRKRRRELENEIADLSARRTTNQSRQLRARNNDEYRAILKEAETINNMLTTREDELLLHMDSGEKMDVQLADLSAEHKAEEALFQDRVKVIEAILKDGQENEAIAVKERGELITTIQPDILSRYMTVARNRDGQAMSPVKDGQCQGCQLSIPPQLFNELQRSDKLMVCPNCARIMYWTRDPYFREFLGEPEAEPVPEKPENRRGRKPKAKVSEEAATDEPTANDNHAFEGAEDQGDTPGAAL
jgi:predicted  nucleic acid-binding Zn-ribbon protein